MVCYDAKHGGSLSGDNASVVGLTIVGDCQETRQSCNIVKMTMIVVWLAQNCWATRGVEDDGAPSDADQRAMCIFP